MVVERCSGNGGNGGGVVLGDRSGELLVVRY
jgi:hypothetical protein